MRLIGSRPIHRSSVAMGISLTVLGLLVFAPSAGALGRAVSATYSCKASALGKSYTFTAPVSVSGTTPKAVAPAASVTMTGFQAQVTIPASIVNDIYAYTHTLSGTLRTFDIVSTNNASTVNAARAGLKFGPVALTQNKSVTIKLPASPAIVGKWTAGTAGTMTFSTGQIAMTFSELGLAVPVSCSPKPAVTLSTTRVS